MLITLKLGSGDPFDPLRSRNHQLSLVQSYLKFHGFISVRKAKAKFSVLKRSRPLYIGNSYGKRPGKFRGSHFYGHDPLRFPRLFT